MPRIKVSTIAAEVTPYQLTKPAAVSVRPSISVFEALKHMQASDAAHPIRMPAKVRSALD